MIARTLLKPYILLPTYSVRKIKVDWPYQESTEQIRANALNKFLLLSVNEPKKKTGGTKIRRNHPIRSYLTVSRNTLAETKLKVVQRAKHQKGANGVSTQAFFYHFYRP